MVIPEKSEIYSLGLVFLGIKYLKIFNDKSIKKIET